MLPDYEQDFLLKCIASTIDLFFFHVLTTFFEKLLMLSRSFFFSSSNSTNIKYSSLTLNVSLIIINEKDL